MHTLLILSLLVTSVYIVPDMRYHTVNQIIKLNCFKIFRDLLFFNAKKQTGSELLPLEQKV